MRFSSSSAPSGEPPRPGHWSRRGAFVLAGLLLAGPLAAQIPGDELPSQSRVRGEYLSATYADIKQILAEWAEHHQTGDVKKLIRMFTDDGLYSPVDGWYAQGRQALTDTLTHRLGRVKNYHASLIDFTASGGLAYYLGRMRYRVEGAGADVSGTFVMVFYLSGRTCRFRSYVERPVGSD